MVHDFDVARLHSVGLVNATLMKSLEYARLSQSTDLVVRVVQFLSFSDSQVQVDIATSLHIVVLDLAAQEVENLLLNLIVVWEGLLSHCESGWHTDPPFDFV